MVDFRDLLGRDSANVLEQCARPDGADQIRIETDVAEGIEVSPR